MKIFFLIPLIFSSNHFHPNSSKLNIKKNPNINNINNFYYSEGFYNVLLDEKDTIKVKFENKKLPPSPYNS